jgi:MoxR-like ATPase
MIRESIAIQRELGDQYFLAGSLESLAALAARTRQPRRAARLFASASTLRRTLGAVRPADENDRADALEQEIRDALSEESFTTEWAWGEAASLEEAIDFALENHDPAQG